MSIPKKLVGKKLTPEQLRKYGFDERVCPDCGSRCCLAHATWMNGGGGGGKKDNDKSKKMRAAVGGLKLFAGIALALVGGFAVMEYSKMSKRAAEKDQSMMEFMKEQAQSAEARQEMMEDMKDSVKQNAAEEGIKAASEAFDPLGSNTPNNGNSSDLTDIEVTAEIVDAGDVNPVDQPLDEVDAAVNHEAANDSDPLLNQPNELAASAAAEKTAKATNSTRQSGSVEESGRKKGYVDPSGVYTSINRSQSNGTLGALDPGNVPPPAPNNNAPGAPEPPTSFSTNSAPQSFEERLIENQLFDDLFGDTETPAASPSDI